MKHKRKKRRAKLKVIEVKLGRERAAGYFAEADELEFLACRKESNPR